MKNIDRLTQFITKHGSKNIIIHTVPETNNWLVCQKIEIDKWLLTLCNPMGVVTYNLGTITDDQHLTLWAELMSMEINKKVSQINLAKQLKETIKKFIKSYENNYKKFTKIEKTKNTKIRNSKKLKKSKSINS